MNDDDSAPDRREIDRIQFSHDLRTPLTVVRGYAELIHRQLAAPDPDLPRIAAMNAKLLAQLARIETAIRATLDPPSTLDDRDRTRTREERTSH